jgi:hypothetical protein
MVPAFPAKETECFFLALLLAPARVLSIACGALLFWITAITLDLFFHSVDILYAVC